jgi:hypothetical protein
MSIKHTLGILGSSTNWQREAIVLDRAFEKAVKKMSTPATEDEVRGLQAMLDVIQQSTPERMEAPYGTKGAISYLARKRPDVLGRVMAGDLGDG